MITVEDDVGSNNYMQLDGTEVNDVLLSRSKFSAMLHPDINSARQTPLQNRTFNDVRYVGAERVNILSGLKEVS